MNIILVVFNDGKPAYGTMTLAYWRDELMSEERPEFLNTAEHNY